MKPRYIIGLLILLVSLSQTVSAQTTNDQLIGTWTFNYDASIAKMDTKSQQLYNRMNDNQKQHLEGLYKDRTIQLDANGDYIQTLSDGRTINRKWHVENGNLIIEDTNGGSDIHHILQLDGTTLILKPNNKGQAIVLISEWHFVKN